MGLVNLNAKGDPVSQFMETFIQEGAKDPKGLQALAVKINKFVSDQFPAMVGLDPKNREDMIAVLGNIRTAIAALRDEMKKCCFAKTSLPEMIRITVEKTLGNVSGESKERLRKYNLAEALITAKVDLDEEGEDFKILKEGEIANCIKKIDDYKGALEKLKK